MRLIALVGDPESGISNITIESNLTWQCQLGLHSEIIGIVESVPVTFSSFAQPSTPVTPLQINVTAIHCRRWVAIAASRAADPINFRGFVRVAATNGQGAVTKSKTYIFDFGDAGIREDAVHDGMPSQGVPIPPNWSVNTNKWVQHGNSGQRQSAAPGQRCVRVELYRSEHSRCLHRVAPEARAARAVDLRASSVRTLTRPPPASGTVAGATTPIR